LGVVDTFDYEPSTSQKDAIPSVSAPKVNRPSRANQLFIHPMGKTLIGRFDEEGTRLRTVFVEPVPPITFAAGQQCVQHAQHILVCVDEFVCHAHPVIANRSGFRPERMSAGSGTWVNQR
jgi:hypothetical protein